jgi:trans-aconitate 2-methyltransferase
MQDGVDGVLRVPQKPADFLIGPKIRPEQRPELDAQRAKYLARGRAHERHPKSLRGSVITQVVESLDDPLRGDGDGLDCLRHRRIISLGDTRCPLRTDTWDPDQYERFERQRSLPFYDLLELVEPCPGGRVVDLGCGTGELTRHLHERTRAAATVGLDSSQAMLERSAEHSADGLTFERGDIADWAPTESLDLIFSNAALQWLDDHDELFARLTGALSPGGQLAVQMPANHDHASHLVAERVAAEEPFRTALDGYVRHSPVLEPERYALLLHRLGYTSQVVRLNVYLHVLPEPEAVVDWVKGTLLTDYRQRLPARIYEDFIARYRELLLTGLPDERPFPFSFKRVLLWGRLG